MKKNIKKIIPFKKKNNLNYYLLENKLASNKIYSKFIKSFFFIIFS